MQSPPSVSPPAREVPAAGSTPTRHPLRLVLAALASVLLVAGATGAGYALGHLRAARPPAAGTVSTPFVQFRLAPGWNVAARTSNDVELRGGTNGYVWVQSGSARRQGVTSDAGLLEQALYGVTQNHLRGSVGTCLPLTRLNVGGKAGEEVGFLFRKVGADGTSTAENCELVWVDVQGSRYYYWTALDTTSHLSRLVRATQEMQGTAVWT